MNKGLRAALFALFLVVLCGISGGSTSRAAGGYMIKVNKQQNVVTIYKNVDGEYKAYKAFVCSAGYATPTGTFNLKEKIRWHVLDGPSYGQYCSRIYNGFLFHSVWYYQNGVKSSQSYTQYNRLGTTASHGCVRLTVADAKWIFDNCPTGTKVVIYNSKKPGPLGKPRAIKVSGYSGWDPTDPDPANPYKKKKPVITGAKNQTLTYGSKFNVMKGIRAKNSTGYDAKDLVKTKILYKMDKFSEYVKVKKVNTKKPGKYKVTYQLTDEIKHKTKKTVVYKVPTVVEVSSITLNKQTKKLYLGAAAEKAKFTLKVKKIKPKKATTKDVKYSSSDKTVATVSKKGVVKAKGPGTAVITVKAQDGSGTMSTCVVTVVQYVTQLKITAPGDTLDVGNAMQLRVAVTPSNATNKAVTYKSSDKTIATVSASGSVRALKSGTVTITATAKDGGKVKATYKIKVVYQYAKTLTAVKAVIVEQGTTWNQVVTSLLPSTVSITDAHENTADADVVWSCMGYDATKAGTYPAVGVVTVPVGWLGPIPDITSTVTVTGPVSGSAVSIMGIQQYR